jgi:hypothetical protein
MLDPISVRFETKQIFLRSTLLIGLTWLSQKVLSEEPELSELQK